MNPEAKDLKIGVFILVAVILLAAGLLLFGGAEFFQQTVTEETFVSGNVNGLEVGAAVTLRGVRVGKVTAIDFTWNPQAIPGFVHIRFAVRSSIYPVRGHRLTELVQAQVSQGLRARVESQGLIGTPLLALEYVDPVQYPPPPLVKAPEHLYIPSAPGQFNQMLASMEQSLHKLSQFDLAKLSAALDQDLVAVDTLLGHVNAVNFPQIATNADALVLEWRDLSTDLRGFVGEFNRTVNQMDLPGVSRNADTLLTRLQTTDQQLNLVLGNLDVPALNETLANLRRASGDLEQTLRALKEYPSGFLFGAPPPPARGIERERR